MSEIRPTEIMAAAGAREIRDGEVVVVGIGLPWVACVLAKRTHAPKLTFLLEIGVMNAEPRDTPVGVADPRNFYRATCWTSFRDVMGMSLHRGVVDDHGTNPARQPEFLRGVSRAFAKPN